MLYEMPFFSYNMLTIYWKKIVIKSIINYRPMIKTIKNKMSL